MLNPKISVIIPVYNRIELLNDAIKSVYDQNYPNLEIVVVDDGSTDNLKPIIEKYPGLIYFKQHNKGSAAARNKGIELSSGEFIAFLDSDDLLGSNMINTLITYLLEHPDADIAEGMLQEIENGNDHKQYQLIGNPYYVCCFGATLIHRSVFEKVGKFNIRLLLAEDIDFYVRLWEGGIIKHRIKIIAVYYRKHEGNLTLKKDESKLYRGMMYQFKLQRERLRGKKQHPLQSLNEYLGYIPKD
jgi:glycosyltransferase involved in cell wall biosynthesis